MDLERISRDEMLMEIAHVIAKRGTCSRLQVGCVVSREGRIISTGYNGAPAGIPHCDHTTPIQELGRLRVPEGCTVASHAEQNAIAYAARHGVALDGSELHVTHAPCLACARSIINAGIRKVSYQTPYRLTEGVDLLAAAGIAVVAAIDSV